LLYPISGVRPLRVSVRKPNDVMFNETMPEAMAAIDGTLLFLTVTVNRRRYSNADIKDVDVSVPYVRIERIVVVQPMLVQYDGRNYDRVYGTTLR